MTQVRLGPSGPFVEVQALPNGTFQYQSLGWDGVSAYIPVTILELSTLRGHAVPPFGTADLALEGENLDMNATGRASMRSGDDGASWAMSGPNVIGRIGAALAGYYYRADAGGSGGAVRMKFFENATPVERPEVTGSQGGNAALASLLQGLAALGLIVDSTSP